MFTRFTKWIAFAVGSELAFIMSLLVVLIWALTGPIFHFSSTWQLVINTSTTIITFWLVFVIQHTQNRQTEIDQQRDIAMHLKLDELIKSIDKADDDLIGIEDTPLD